jgi:hypothetical protein
MIQRILVFLYRYLLAAGACLYLLTVGLFRSDRREILHEILFRLGWRKRPPPEPSGPPLLIPPIQTRELLPAESVIRLLEPDTTSGNVSGFELAVIDALVAAIQPAACFEIGTFDGRTTINLAANGPENGRIYTLDLPPEGLGHTRHSIACGDEKYIQKPQSGARFLGTRWAARITQLYGDSATFDFTPYEGRMDLVFVDGSRMTRARRSSSSSRAAASSCGTITAPPTGRTSPGR